MIPFRTRRILRRILITLLVLVLLAAAAALCWLLWLNRYIVYTRSGAKLDFDMSPVISGGVAAVAPTTGDPVDIYYDDSVDTPEPETNELTQLAGCYVTEQMLAENFDAVAAQLRSLSPQTPVLLDVKNLRSEFFYTTDLGRNNGNISAEAMDGLIAELKDAGHYLVARLPAFREYWYILDDEQERVPYGLPRVGGGGSLWLDESGPNYWLNPESEGTLGYLVQIVRELRDMGFDEVVFTDFRFPDTDRVEYSGDKAAVIETVAQTLVKVCATDTFAVSFTGTDVSFPLPEGRSRLYLENAAAADVSSLAQQTGLADPFTRLVFITELLDTRYDSYSVLRPLEISE